MENRLLAQRLRHLVIFKNLRTNPLMKALADLLASEKVDRSARACDLAAELYPLGVNLHQAVAELLRGDDNFCVRECAALRPLQPQVQACLEAELQELERAVRATEAFQGLGLPAWDTQEEQSFVQLYEQTLLQAPQQGSGIFSQYHVFSISAQGTLEPVVHPDPQRLNELYGYETQRDKLLRNTQALLHGLPANNILLYGDAGTGKSSVVKALANEYKDQGLRLIQVEKSRLRYIPALLDSLSANPLKFILFIDDLSFATVDQDFTALKTVLEGSVAARSANIVVYATSNRRHLVQESFQSRQGDEIHLNDTLEEVASLSARFGIMLTFSKPGKDLYLKVTARLAQRYGLDLPEEVLFREAEAFALRAGGRSPRVARQYVEDRIVMSDPRAADGNE